MSLINEALKRARQDPPGEPPRAFPPLLPAAAPAGSSKIWLVLVVLILLIIGTILGIGWTLSRQPLQPVQSVVVAPAATPIPVAPEEMTSPPPAAPAGREEPPASPPPPALVPINPPDAPKLQGIFYSPAAPSAIVAGKMVRVGDIFLQYRVAQITQYAVTLVESNGQAIKIGLGN